MRWLFVGSDDAGAVNALLASLLASCQLRDRALVVSPRPLLLLPQWPEHVLLEIAPLNWNKTKTRHGVLALLEANPFRKLSLDARG